MRKILSFLLALSVCFCPLLFTACAKSQQPLNLNTYMKTDAKYKVYGGSSEGVTDKLSSFSDNKFDNLAQYTEIDLEGNANWLYKMTISKITFEVYANQTDEIQFKLTFDNLKNTSRHNGEFTNLVKVEKGKTTKVVFDIDDYVESMSSTTRIKILVDNYSVFFADNKNTGLKIDISNFKIYGTHDLSKIK